MKILLCTPTFVTGRGGIPSYARDFVESFKKEHEIVVVTGGKDIDDSPCKLYYINDIELSFKNAKKLYKIIEDEQPEIIINSAHFLLSIISPYINNNIKIISISHFVDGYYAKIAGTKSQYIDNIVALSSFSKSFIEKKYSIKDDNKVVTIYNFMPVLKEGPNVNKEKNDVINIVYPGGSNYQKSADIFLKAILHLLKKDIKFNLYWIGNKAMPGSKWNITIINSLSDILPKDNRIVHLGSVSREEAKNIMANANVFVLPSRGEGFPISIIEAMRGRCIPVISDAKHGALDIIENGVNGYVTKQGDYLDLAKCIENIIINHNSLSGIYDAAYDTYLQNLTTQVWVERMEKILLSENNHTPRKIYSENKTKVMMSLLTNKLYLLKFRLKQIFVNNIRTLFTYYIIAINKKKY